MKGFPLLYLFHTIIFSVMALWNFVYSFDIMVGYCHGTEDEKGAVAVKDVL